MAPLAQLLTSLRQPRCVQVAEHRSLFKSYPTCSETVVCFLTMSAARMQLLYPRNLRLLSRGRSELAGGGGPAAGVRSPLTSPTVSSSSPGRALSSLSATRRGLPKEKMSENGVSSRGKVLTIDTMNPTVKKVEYAVRGPIVQRAVELERELSEVCTRPPDLISVDHSVCH